MLPRAKKYSASARPATPQLKRRTRLARTWSASSDARQHLSTVTSMAAGITAAAEKIGVWDEAKMAEYLASPKDYVGGKSKMTFKLKKEDQRKDVAAYLASLNK